MTAQPPTVTIGIPCYNREHLIGRSIASALAQDHRAIELVISDNASSDRTGEICLAHAAADARIVYLRQPHNLGPTPNFDAVLERATGRYFMWLGDDDWLDPGYVSAMLRILESGDSVALASGRPQYYHDGRPAHAGRSCSATSRVPFLRVLAYYWQVQDNGGFYGLMHTDAARRAALPNRMGGDWLFVARLAAAGRIVMAPLPTVHRELGGSTASYARIAQTLGAPAWQARYPFTAIAAAAGADIARADGPFGTRPAPLRFAMAAAAFACIVAKVPVQAAKKFLLRCRDLLRGTRRQRSPNP